MSSEKSITDENKSVLGYFILCITKKYFCFKGRARRKEYWSFILFNFLISFAFGFLGGFFNASAHGVAGIIDILGNIVSLALIIPGYAVLFRRLHDVNFSGWWAILPILGILISGIMSGYISVSQQIGTGTAGIEIIPIIATVIGFISIIAGLLVFILTFRKSSMKENKYGPVPEGVK